MPARCRFRAPDGHLILCSVDDDTAVTHAMLAKDDKTDRWSIIGTFGTIEAAAQKLEHHALTAPAMECLIIEREPY
jgi:hypothetical protein